MKPNLKKLLPGRILFEEFLKPVNISAYRLAKETYIEPKRISEIIHGKRSITADTALRLSRFFGNSPEYWMNLQNRFDLESKKDSISKELKAIKSVKELV